MESIATGTTAYLLSLLSRSIIKAGLKHYSDIRANSDDHQTEFELNNNFKDSGLLKKWIPLVLGFLGLSAVLINALDYPMNGDSMLFWGIFTVLHFAEAYHGRRKGI